MEKFLVSRNSRVSIVLILLIMSFGIIRNCVADATYVETNAENAILSQGILMDGSDCFLANSGNDYVIKGPVNLTSLMVFNNSNVSIQGNVLSQMPDGVWDENFALDINNGSLYVHGNVVSMGNRNFSVFAEKNASVIIDGNVESEKIPLYLETDTDIVIGNNVKSKTSSAIVIDLQRAEKGNDSRIIVLGKIIPGSSSPAIRIDQWDIATDVCKNNLPKVILYEIDAIDTEQYVAGADDPELNQALLNSIQYIVKVDSKNIIVEGYNDSILLKNSSQVYHTAVSGTKLLVKPVSGIKLIDVYAGDNADVVNNNDGTFSVIIQDGGGVTIKAKGVPEIAMPQTGDNSHIALWLVLLMLAGTAMLILKRKIA